MEMSQYVHHQYETSTGPYGVMECNNSDNSSDNSVNSNASNSNSDKKMLGKSTLRLSGLNNPGTDRLLNMDRFHHIEFYCGDASNTAKRFGWGLGMHEAAKSDLSTGNREYASYAMKSNELVFVFTASYNANVGSDMPSRSPHPAFSPSECSKFVIDHGLAVKSLGLKVEDAAIAYDIAVSNGATGVLLPYSTVDKFTGKSQVFSEIKYLGDTIIRFVSGEYDGSFLANYEEVSKVGLGLGLELELGLGLGLTRLDHAVSNVADLVEAVDYVSKCLGLHEFSEFIAADVGTVDSGLNTIILANKNEKVLLPINEPTFGTRRKSQIQSFLEWNRGSGFQHLALKTDDILSTIKEMRRRSYIGGFAFMPSPDPQYYRRLSDRLGKEINDIFSKDQVGELQKFGILVDKDSEGWILQIFTEPIGDRNTIFLEIIQRIGCDVGPHGEPKEQAGGCGGFGKGNFAELFKAVEVFEVNTEDSAIKFASRSSSAARLSSESEASGIDG